MIKNMGSTDRIIRSAAAILILIFIFTGALEGAAAVILGIVAAMFLGTSAIGHCPMYPPLKITTLRKK
jgi:hypothetical protein